MSCPLRNQPFVPPDYIINDPTRDEVDIMIVGMNPYVDEIKQNKPFVGRSGKKLREILNQIFPDKNIVITNTCMCFVPDNKDPDKQAQECCKPLLIEQIKRVKPKVVVPLGGLAASNLLGQQVAITKVAGQKFEIEID
jgi:DNA polymerase